MFKLIINEFAEETLEKVSQKDKRTFLRLSKALDEIEQKGLQSSNINALKNAPKIFRGAFPIFCKFSLLFSVKHYMIPGGFRFAT